jgi:adenylate cyclase class 2
VSIEVELKCRVRDPEAVTALLAARAPGEASMYRDAYYDFPDRRLERDGRREMRLRTVVRDDLVRYIWTFKAPALDADSIPELETDVADVRTAAAILAAIGMIETIAYTKECTNYRFDADGYPILATMVRLPETDGTFLEVETLVPEGADRTGARDVIRRVIADLGLGDQDLDPTYYIDLVAAARAS